MVQVGTTAGDETPDPLHATTLPAVATLRAVAGMVATDVMAWGGGSWPSATAGKEWICQPPYTYVVAIYGTLACRP